MAMNWFEKYSQQDTGDGEVTESAEGGMVTESDGIGESAYEPIVFDGPGVNQYIVDTIISPLNSIDPAVYEFLDTVPSDAMSRVLTDLAHDGMLGQFKESVESYVKDGYYQEIVSGTQSGLSRLEEWLANFKAVGGDRSPFGTLESGLSNFTQS